MCYDEVDCYADSVSTPTEGGHIALQGQPLLITSLLISLRLN